MIYFVLIFLSVMNFGSNFCCENGKQSQVQSLSQLVDVLEQATPLSLETAENFATGCKLHDAGRWDLATASFKKAAYESRLYKNYLFAARCEIRSSMAYKSEVKQHDNHLYSMELAADDLQKSSACSFDLAWMYKLLYGKYTNSKNNIRVKQKYQKAVERDKSFNAVSN